MKPIALVLSTVHRPDDTRIRERLIRSLASSFAVDYASKEPGPTDTTGLRWVPLRGRRAGRWLQALAMVMLRKWDVLVLHDPETIPIGIAARALRRRPVVFDVHEDIPATALTRPWVPAPLRRPLAVLSRWTLTLAERFLLVTLAETGYTHLFRKDHVVFPNYPDTGGYPSPSPISRREVVHVGDITLARGLDVAVEAAGLAGVPLRLIGPVADDVRSHLTGLASQSGAEVMFEGPLPNPEAMAITVDAAVAIVPWKDLPNYRESVPTKLFEYLALGLPVVASDLPGIRSVGVEDLAVVLVAPGDPEALSAGIKSALDGGLGPAARADADTVRARYKWPGAEVSDFYLSLAGRGESQRPSSNASLPGPEV